MDISNSLSARVLMKDTDKDLKWLRIIQLRDFACFLKAQELPFQLKNKASLKLALQLLVRGLA
jgi:hypothetical protein